MAFLHTVLALAVAFVLGTSIGFERQWRQRNAGLRTVVLVAVSAAAFVDLGFRLHGAQGAVSIIAYVVSGIGFLGAGVILQDGPNIRGLNTAAAIWTSASVGAFAGAGLPLEASAVTAFILAVNTLLRPLVESVDRRPFRYGETEALYRLLATCLPTNISDVRDLMEEALTRRHYPIRQIEVTSGNEDQVELAATLVPTTADAAELDQVVAEREQSSLVRSATWTVGTTL